MLLKGLNFIIGILSSHIWEKIDFYLEPLGEPDTDKFFDSLESTTSSGLTRNYETLANSNFFKDGKISY